MPKKTAEQLLKDHLRTLGSKGGKTTAKKLTAQERTERAKSAATARWGTKTAAPAKSQGDPLTRPLPVKTTAKPTRQDPLKDQGDALASGKSKAKRKGAK